MIDPNYLNAQVEMDTLMTIQLGLTARRQVVRNWRWYFGNPKDAHRKEIGVRVDDGVYLVSSVNIYVSDQKFCTISIHDERDSTAIKSCRKSGIPSP